MTKHEIFFFLQKIFLKLFSIILTFITRQKLCVKRGGTVVMLHTIYEKFQNYKNQVKQIKIIKPFAFIK